MLGNMGMGEWIVVLVIVLVLFGAKRIPEISASFGKGIREFKKNVSDVQTSITEPEPRAESRLNTGDLQMRREAEEAARPEPKRLI